MTDGNYDQIRALVSNIAAKNMIDVEAQFKTIMGDTVAVALDARRAEVAQSIYGGAPESETEDEHSDEDGSEGTE